MWPSQASIPRGDSSGNPAPCGWSCEKGGTTGELGLKSSQVKSWVIGEGCCSRELTKLAPALTQDIVHTPAAPSFLLLSQPFLFLSVFPDPVSASLRPSLSPGSTAACLLGPAQDAAIGRLWSL